MKKFLQKFKLFFVKGKKESNIAAKIRLSGGASLILSGDIEKNKELIENKIKEIIIEDYKNPAKILDFAKREGTGFYQIKNAGKILKFINLPPGLIFPKSGISALFLNLAVQKKISFKSNMMFVFEAGALNLYAVLYNFYKWYLYKINPDGLDIKFLNMLNNIDKYTSSRALNKLSINDIAAFKQAVQWDKNAALFTINFIKQIHGGKSAFNTIKNKGSANI